MGNPTQVDYAGQEIVCRAIRTGATHPGDTGSELALSETDGDFIVDGTFTIGEDDTGHDVKFFGATTAKSWLWDESADKMIVTGDASVSGTTTLSGATTQTGVLTFNSDPVIGAGKTINLDSNTATCSSNAATLTKFACVVTSEALTTAHTASQALALTLTGVAAGDLAFVTLVGGTNTGGIPLFKAACTTNTVTVTISNMAKATDAFNGTFIFNLWVLKA